MNSGEPEEDLNANIELLEFKTEVAARAEKLEYLRRANPAQRCWHVMSNGDTCGCPALCEQQYCRFHGQAYQEEIELPVIEDVDSLQIAYMSLAKRIVTGKIAAAEAKLLLQVAKSPKWRGIQIGFIAYFFLFVIFFAWKSIIGYAIVALVAVGLVVFLFLRWRNSN